MTEPENIVLRLLREMREEMRGTKDEMLSKLQETRDELRSEMRSLRADVASDLIQVRADMHSLEKRLNEQISGLRRAVVEYHSAVVGHGMLIGELDVRLGDVERRLEAH